jgi:hypothetical protein
MIASYDFLKNRNCKQKSGMSASSPRFIQALFDLLAYYIGREQQISAVGFEQARS